MVNVLVDRTVKGIDRLDTPPRRRGRLMTLEEALYLEHESDAHIVPVVPFPLDDGESCPRLKKAVLPEVRDAGYDLVMTALFYDLDNPQHVANDESTAATYRDLVNHLPTHLKPTAHYATRNGWRVVYQLDPPLPVDDAERAHRGFAQVLIAAGLPIDEECKSDWTHIYRAPSVVRDDSPTWEEPHAYVHVNGRRLDPERCPRRGPKGGAHRIAHVDAWDGDMPDEQEVLRIVGYRGETDFARAAKRALSGRGSYAVCFEERAIGTPGNRDNQLFGLIRQVFERLFADYPDYATPEHVFALFYRAARALSHDEHRELTKLWDKVLREWQHQAGKRKAIEEEPDRILQTMRTIYPGELPDDDDEAREEIVTRLIAVHKSDFYMLDAHTGYYHVAPYQPSTFAAGLHEQGIAGVVDYQKFAKNGTRSIRPLVEIFEKHGVQVAEVLRRPTDKPTPGAWLEDRKLIIPAYWLRTDLGAEFNQDVDTYYRLLFGEDYELAMRWIAGALSINAGPIAAMMLIGAPRSGKGMFVQGLAECFSNDLVVDGHSETGDYQTGDEGKSPIVCYDEGLPDVRDFSTLFRRSVAGQSRVVNVKYQPTQRFEAYPRILITANDEEVIHDIAARTRVMSESDVAAVAERLLVLHAHQEAADWLKRKGGWRLTAGWAQSPTASSNRVLARHNLWVWENKKAPPASRFLVEGNAAELVQREMAVRSGVASDVLKALIGYLQSMKRRHATDRDHVAVFRGAVWVTSTSVVRYIERNLGNFQGKVSEKYVAQVLRLNGCEQTTNAVMRNTHGGKKKRARWWRLDIDHLLDYAEEIGADCDHLSELLSP